MKNPKFLFPAEPKPSQFTAQIDRREQDPVEISGGMKWEFETLTFGDYSVRGLTDKIRAERKSLSDLLACIGRERERFERSLLGHRGFEYGAVFVEAEWSDLMKAEWRSKLTSAQVIGTILGWTAGGTPILFTKDHKETGLAISRFLFISARRAYRELRALAGEFSNEHQEQEVET